MTFLRLFQPVLGSPFVTNLFDIVEGHIDSPWSVVIVVSPLSALMEDQLAALISRGIRAAKCIDAANEDNRSLFSEGYYQIVFTSLQILLNKSWSDVFRSESLCQRLRALVNDEAHCVKKWYISEGSAWLRLCMCTHVCNLMLIYLFLLLIFERS